LDFRLRLKEVYQHVLNKECHISDFWNEYFVLKVFSHSCDVVEACFNRLILHVDLVNREYDLCNIDENNFFYITFYEFFWDTGYPIHRIFQNKMIEKSIKNHKKSKVGCCSRGWLGRWVVKRTIQQNEMKSKTQLHDRPQLIHAQIKLDVTTL
jgi:hypothetical protein